MKRVVCCLFVGLLTAKASAQEVKESAEVVSKQCSAIRELVYAAATAKFEPIRLEQVRGSNGHQTNGTWQFSTTRYNASISWQGANTSYLEHYEESTDSTRQETWQYIAEYSHVSSVLEAQKLFSVLNSEIEGCMYPLDDTTDVAFLPLPPDRLPADRPSSLEIAKLYELPLPNLNAVTEGAIMVMVGMERRAKDYRISLIVENALK